jgi:predicted transcriptional regulator
MRKFYQDLRLVTYNEVVTSRAERGINIRRDKLEIIRSILLICKKKDANKTKIVYQANLNFKTAGVYIDWLINHELIKKEDSTYQITPKGNGLLSNLQDVSLFFNETND